MADGSADFLNAIFGAIPKAENTNGNLEWNIVEAALILNIEWKQRWSEILNGTFPEWKILSPNDISIVDLVLFS